jgi:hypothetical protein
MKLSNSLRVNRIGRIARYMLIGGAAAAFLGLSLNAQAQTCTVENWSDSPGLTAADTGFQGSDNRRYGGPCGLRVPFDGSSRYVEYESAGEGNYIARFYVFLDELGGDAAIFKAEDNGGDVLVVSYDNGDIVLTAVDQADTSHPLAITGVGNGWHSVEITWLQGSDATQTEVTLLVNSEDPNDGVSTSIDTTGMAIDLVKLGNVDGVSTGGSADFDDFDSRRSSRPGRLLVGDAANTGSNDSPDLVAARNEILGNSFAPGQPDCNEDGDIGSPDLVCIRNILLGN